MISIIRATDSPPVEFVRVDVSNAALGSGNTKIEVLPLSVLNLCGAKPDIYGQDVV